MIFCGCRNFDCFLLKRSECLKKFTGYLNLLNQIQSGAFGKFFMTFFKVLHFVFYDRKETENGEVRQG